MSAGVIKMVRTTQSLGDLQSPDTTRVYNISCKVGILICYNSSNGACAIYYIVKKSTYIDIVPILTRSDISVVSVDNTQFSVQTIGVYINTYIFPLI